MKILVTGGSGFIGSNLVRLLVKEKGCTVINLDKLTYAGNPESLADLEGHPNYTFEQIDLAAPSGNREGLLNDSENADSLSGTTHPPSQKTLQAIFEQYQPDAVMHLAAESHVDRSIDGPGEFIQTNVIGTFNLLQASLQYWRGLPEAEDRSQEIGVSCDTVESDQPSAIRHHSSPTKSAFRFLHVSTDEVYGSLAPEAPGFSETHAYDPHSPYSASKAASDHLARAWGDTYGLPILVTNCSNNYGPYQFPEKLIPVVILKCLRGESIPVYGKGENIRDWLYVTDHAEALHAVLTKGRVGETYNIGGNNERQNIELVRTLCQLMDELVGYERLNMGDGAAQNPISDLPSPASSASKSSKSFQDLITFVKDRPGHDMRYAIDPTKIRDELGWEPKEDFASGFRKTVQWYLDNREWTDNILSGDYQLDRLGES